MSQHQYEDAAQSDTINYQELRGSLLLVSVLEALDHVPTVMTPPGEKSPAVRADVTILDGPKAGTTLVNTLVFPKVLQGRLRPRVGKLILGRLGQGEAKVGQTAPWVLDPPTDADRAVADRWLAHPQGSGSHTEPEPPF